MKKYVELRSRILALCQPVDEVAENISQKEFDETKQTELNDHGDRYELLRRRHFGRNGRITEDGQRLIVFF